MEVKIGQQISLKEATIEPVNGFVLTDGYNSITTSLNRIFNYYDYFVDEETLLGLGSGMGFVYWHRKGQLPYMSGRGVQKDFYQKLSAHTGIQITENVTSSSAKAQRIMLAMLEDDLPIMVYGDIAALPYWQREYTPFRSNFNNEKAYHFGSHAFVIVGADPKTSKVLIADYDPNTIGLKTGRYEIIDFEDLRNARGAKCRHNPPKNRWFTFNFANAHTPSSEDFYLAIYDTLLHMLKPQLTNMGVSGIRKMASEIIDWPKKMDSSTLARALYNLYIQIEINGTGGGNFRSMYARFLNVARKVTGNPWLDQSAQLFDYAAKQWMALAHPLKSVYDIPDPAHLIRSLSEDLEKVSYTEETALKLLASALPQF